MRLLIRPHLMEDLGYWFEKKNTRKRKKNIHFFLFKLPLELSCSLLALFFCLVCEVALSWSRGFFFPFYICSTCSSHSSYLKLPVHFLKKHYFFFFFFFFWSNGAKWGKLENEKQPQPQPNKKKTRKNKKDRKLRLLVWIRAVAFEMSRVIRLFCRIIRRRIRVLCLFSFIRAEYSKLQPTTPAGLRHKKEEAFTENTENISRRSVINFLPLWQVQ